MDSFCKHCVVNLLQVLMAYRYLDRYFGCIHLGGNTEYIYRTQSI